MSDQMKAAFFEEYGEPGVVKTGNLPKPQPGEGELLVKVEAAGVNPVDYFVVAGFLKERIPATFPSVPGWDLAGTVVETGFAVSRFNPGDEVFAYARRPAIQHGTFAEYVVIPESYLALRPQNISVEEAGGIPLVGLTAYQSLFDEGNLQEEQSVLILGASGGVGTLAIQLAKTKGAEVIGVASEKNHTYMQEIGADHTVDYNDQNVGKAVLDIAPNGVDLIFDCSRGETFGQVVEAGVLKKGGTIVSITKSKPEIPADINFSYVFVEPNARQLDHLAELADAGNIRVPVSKTFSLEQVPEALTTIEQLHTRGKIVVTP